MYLKTLTNLNKLAAEKPVAFVAFWVALSQFHSKSTSFATTANQFLGTEKPVAVAPYSPSADELAEEAKLNLVLSTEKKADGTPIPASGINYHKVLTWLSTVDIGDAVLAKVNG